MWYAHTRANAGSRTRRRRERLGREALAGGDPGRAVELASPTTLAAAAVLLAVRLFRLGVVAELVSHAPCLSAVCCRIPLNPATARGLPRSPRSVLGETLMPGAAMRIRDLTSIPVTIDEDEEPMQAARRMIRDDIGHLPVLRDGRLVGIVTGLDFLALLAGERSGKGARDRTSG